MLRKLFVDILIRLLERTLYNTPVKKLLDEEQMQKFYATLYETPGFHQYSVERETRMIHSLASKDNETVRGQRVENSLLFSKCQRAYQKLQDSRKKQESLAKGGQSPATSRKP